MYKRNYKSPCHGPISQKMMSYYRWPGVWQQLNRNFHHNSLQALDWVQRKTKHCNTELAAYHSRPQFWRQCTHKSTHFSFVWCLTTIFNLTSTDEKFFFYFPKLAGFTKRLTAIYWFLLYSFRFWFFSSCCCCSVAAPSPCRCATFVNWNTMISLYGTLQNRKSRKQTYDQTIVYVWVCMRNTGGSVDLYMTLKLK